MKLIDKDALIAEIKKRIDFCNKLADASAELNLHNSLEANELLIRQYENLLSFLDTLEVKEVREESVSKDLEEAAFDYAEACKNDGGEKLLCVEHFKAGAQWQKQQNTLEVKEVDLEKAIDGLTAGWIEGEEYGELQNINTCRCVTLGEVKGAMRCMFELGLKVAQKGE